MSHAECTCRMTPIQAPLHGHGKHAAAGTARIEGKGQMRGLGSVERQRRL